MKIEVRGVQKAYDGVPVIERLDLTIETGSFVTVVGASGCGKSTFLNMLLSQEQPTRGEIFVDGEPLPAEPGPERGIVFQRYSVLPHLTVEENLILADEFAAAPFWGRMFGKGRQDRLDRLDTVLEQIGLSAARKKYPSQLSGGMQQRLAIAQSLLKEPRILLLDEPFGALDPGIRVDMHALLLDLWRTRGMTILMVTHDLHEAFKLGTRMLVFDKIRHDPDDPTAYGAIVTYDLPIGRDEHSADTPPDAEAFDLAGKRQ